jgi:23S rRNA (cytidine1920-2'-O)/16S rRNA (cytidine1409-2'-O)-methyltransferase
VSRGGDKLAHALTAFGIQPLGLVCLDVGASTGGFTDCLLQHGASLVYAIDVGHSQLDPRLRQDPRVVVMERTNARNLEAVRLPTRPDLAVVDVSFISLEKVLPGIFGVVTPGQVVALVKPQFEAGREAVGKGGVVRDPDQHRAVLDRVARFALAQGWGVRAVTTSPLRGPKGNREFFLFLVSDGVMEGSLAEMIERVIGSEA